jgi:hypothetical protein
VAVLFVNGRLERLDLLATVHLLTQDVARGVIAHEELVRRVVDAITGQKFTFNDAASCFEARN